MRKFLILLFAALIICLPAIPKVSAEQAAAEQYRQMFRSGNFYVEYRLFREVDGHTFRSSNIILSGKDGRRMFRETNEHTGNMNKGYFDGENLSNIYSSFNPMRRPMTMQIFKVKNWPDALYQNGKYYIFHTSGTAARGLTFPSKKHVTAIVLPEDQLNSPVLDNTEGWEFVREDLALPDELAVFCWNDPFRDNSFNLPAPTYNGSSKRTVDNKEYDCDQYINSIKTLAGNVIAQEAYNMLYENGKLVMIQKYLLRNGKEFPVREFQIKEITADVPESAFEIGTNVKVYAAANGDMNDLLEHRTLVETLGGK